MSEVDIRGEPCGMPVVRVEKYLLKESGGASFVVLGDDATTIDQLRLLATKHGWSCEVTPLGREYRAQFRPAH
ncbi:MAG TPA: sulfurtransferase TusA family protein [Planctomycetota bacterium]|nr:sulfurtransferase TusA family protein [Planctomycetota bacterium]